MKKYYIEMSHCEHNGFMFKSRLFDTLEEAEELNENIELLNYYCTLMIISVDESGKEVIEKKIEN